MNENVKIGDRVSICGAVFYGDRDYKVCCDGTIEDVDTKQGLVLVDEIDGDFNVCAYVDKNIIKKVYRREER